MSNNLTLREQLDKCWQFADNYKWLAIASNLNPEDPICGELKPSYPKFLDVQISYIFFVRYNDWLLFTFIPNQGWRHQYNMGRKRFSCLISNSEVFLDHPNNYQRLFIQGEFRSYQQSSKTYKKFIQSYLEVFSTEKDTSDKIYNPVLKIPDHCLGIFKPDLVEYSFRGEPPEYPEIRNSINLTGTNFDEDGNLMSF